MEDDQNLTFAIITIVPKSAVVLDADHFSILEKARLDDAANRRFVETMSDIPLTRTQTDPAIQSLPSRPLASASAEATAIPWTIWAVFWGIIMALIGGTWDFAWHMSVGRETFWTSAHVLIQLGAILIGVGSASSIFSTTSAGASPTREISVRMLGLWGPAGAFTALWGSLAMISSAPFDDWWHNAYGLDTKLLTPPHILLSLGWLATQIGAMTWMASVINRSTGALRTRLTWLFVVVAGICVGLHHVLALTSTLRQMQHTAACYLAVAIFFPAILIAAGRCARPRWGCTIVAAVYTADALAGEWLLPLIPAQPKMGPVYQSVTHLIPLQFPLLLIVPAFVADFLLQRLEQRSAWIKAVVVGPAFVLSHLAVQWPFANFLMSPASRNWIFGSHYFPFFDTAFFLYDPYQFNATEKPAAFVITMAIALVVSIVTARLGVAWGGWMRRVRR